MVIEVIQFFWFGKNPSPWGFPLPGLQDLNQFFILVTINSRRSLSTLLSNILCWDSIMSLKLFVIFAILQIAASEELTPCENAILK